MSSSTTVNAVSYTNDPFNNIGLDACRNVCSFLDPPDIISLAISKKSCVKLANDKQVWLAQKKTHALYNSDAVGRDFLLNRHRFKDISKTNDHVLERLQEFLNRISIGDHGRFECFFRSESVEKMYILIGHGSNFIESVNGGIYDYCIAFTDPNQPLTTQKPTSAFYPYDDVALERGSNNKNIAIYARTFKEYAVLVSLQRERSFTVSDLESRVYFLVSKKLAELSCSPTRYRIESMKQRMKNRFGRYSFLLLKSVHCIVNPIPEKYIPRSLRTVVSIIESLVVGSILGWGIFNLCLRPASN